MVPHYGSNWDQVAALLPIVQTKSSWKVPTISTPGGGERLLALSLSLSVL